MSVNRTAALLQSADYVVSQLRANLATEIAATNAESPIAPGSAGEMTLIAPRDEAIFFGDGPGIFPQTYPSVRVTGPLYTPRGVISRGQGRGLVELTVRIYLKPVERNNSDPTPTILSHLERQGMALCAAVQAVLERDLPGNGIIYASRVTRLQDISNPSTDKPTLLVKIYDLTLSLSVRERHSLGA